MKVKNIELWSSKTLFENHKQWGLHRLSCLEEFNIGGWEDDSFPDEGLLPTTLPTIHIYYSSKLETLNGKAFQQLTSLKTLRICNCTRLQCLPEEGLPSCLSFLEFYECDLIKQHSDEGREDWPKHITQVAYNGSCIN